MRLTDYAVGYLEVALHGVDYRFGCDGTGHLTGLIAAHTVGNHGQPYGRVCDRRIFVMEAFHPRVGDIYQLNLGGEIHGREILCGAASSRSGGGWQEKTDSYAGGRTQARSFAAQYADPTCVFAIAIVVV
jgi:hypothetical protein